MGLRMTCVALIVAAMASGPALAAQETPVVVALEPGGRSPDDHCTWVSSVARRMQLACADADGAWTYPYVAEDFDEYTLGKAEAGDPRSMLLMGMLYFTTVSGVHDPVKAMTWFRKAADKGEAGAMFGIGAMYQSGQGVAKDPVEAARWIEKSAEAGNVPAMFMIGMYYDHGYGVAQDDAKAVRWYRAGADRGDTGCMAALSNMYRDGRGVPKDQAESDRWWQRYDAAAKAAMNGQ